VVRVLTHSRAILNQWRREVIDKLGILADRELGYEYPIFIDGFRINFQTLQTAYKEPERYAADLLIVDEVHHTAAQEFRKALTVPAKWRMGLSATIEGEERVGILHDELGPTVYQFNIREAIEKKVVPRFDWKLHTTYLSIKEEEEFRKLSRDIASQFVKVKYDRDTIKAITKDANFTIENLHDFVRLVEQARYRGIRLPEYWVGLQIRVLRRRWIIHRSRPRIDHAIELARVCGQVQKVIVFAMDIESCDIIGRELRDTLPNVFVVHSQIKEDPSHLLERFRECKQGVLIGAHMLEEGIDIPDAEIGISVASSRTRLQLIQRMGRILRMMPGKKPVFHHYLALPREELSVPADDDLRLVDDLAWVQDTSLSMGIRVEMAEEEAELAKMRERAEMGLSASYLRKKVATLPGTGTLRLESILSRFDDEARSRLIQMLDNLSPDLKISDKEWSAMIRKAFAKVSETEPDHPINIPGSWYVLVIGNRNPVAIKELITSVG
jgi:superfamily II DNA or RNA helicase